MPKDAGVHPSASVNDDGAPGVEVEVSKGEKVSGRSWNAILVVSIIGIALVVINYMNSEMAPPPGAVRSSPAPAQAAEVRSLRKPTEPLVSQQQVPVVVSVPSPEEQELAWQAPPYKTSGFVGLPCINGTSADVMFKEGEYHAMCIHNGKEMISMQIKAAGKWEGDLCNKIQHYEKLGRSITSSKFWFVDVGANIGFLSLCGYQILPTVSIEAAPWNFNMLDQTRQHWQSGWNDRPWYTVHQAVSTSAGHTVKLLGSVENFGGTNLVDPANHPHHLSHGWGEGKDIRYGTVVTNTLDNIVKTHIPKDSCIAVMKVDIEGYEYFGMQSFEEGLRTRPPCNIFMEYHTILLKAASSKERDDPSALRLAGILQAAGYVGDQTLPQDASTDVELNIHWQMKNPKETHLCDCQPLVGPFR